MDSSDSFKKYLLYSVSFHALILTLLLLFAEPPPPPPKTTTQVTMIRLSRTGSPNAPLLEKPPQAAKPTEAGSEQPPIPVAKPAPIEAPPAPPKPTPAKPAPAPPPPQGSQVVHVGKEKQPPPKPTPAAPAPVTPPKKPAPPSAQDQQISQALSQVQEELKQRETQAQPAAPPSGAAPEGSGQVPAFGSPNGVIGAVDPGYAQYQASVRSKIVREWIRTNSGPGEEKVLRARIQVRINASGAVIAKGVQRSSGDESFDLSALRAIERASPLPPPPEGIKAEALSEGFVVDFNSRMLGSR